MKKAKIRNMYTVSFICNFSNSNIYIYIYTHTLTKKFIKCSRFLDNK